MSRHTRPLCLVGTILVLLLGTWAGVSAQPATPPAPAGADEVPGSIREACGEAERLGETEAEEEEEGFSPWLDWVHAIGITGAGLMVANFLLGLSIFLGALAGAARFPVLKRKGRRKWHYVFGLTTLFLATLHSVLRFVQAGEFDLGDPRAVALGATAVLLALSRMVRAWPPRPLARYPQVWKWTHRASVAVAVVLLTLHGLRPLVMMLWR